MRTLVIDTATAACSVALIEHGRVMAATHEEVARGHAERLLPMIADLPSGGRADAILVDCGPGSFTGIRVGLAAARGLGLGWGVPISGYSSLALLASQHFMAHPECTDLAVVLEGGHGEVFMQSFTSSPFAALGAMQSLQPEAGLAALGNRVGVGNGVRWLATLDPTLRLVALLPDAAAAALLPQSFTLLDPRPIYGRAPDAKPMAVA
ncbi:MAG: tRNA (adenosine(37)-N6)-threonylcarbamoyltransferase complex dimerization subunit type 1 TsaB [Sphingomonas sp.]|nr:tRNA (adenosine(37)-N6)-threonylcarbamoyltransferase complex dimerization subunit type 1 TsaB [Sphingomonas sp.]